MRSDTKKNFPSQNVHNNKSPDDAYRNESNLKNKYADEDEDYEDEMYDQSPYDEYGYQNANQANNDNDDPLALIKKTLRSDFASKLHGSPTMRQA